jgi:hypothetical protein
MRKSFMMVCLAMSNINWQIIGYCAIIGFALGAFFCIAIWWFFVRKG